MSDVRFFELVRKLEELIEGYETYFALIGCYPTSMIEGEMKVIEKLKKVMNEIGLVEEIRNV